MEKMKFLGYLEIQLMTCKETFDKFLELLIKNQSVSSNINEVIRSVLNLLISVFFFAKRFHKYKKAQNRLQRTKIKRCVQKNM